MFALAAPVIALALAATGVHAAPSTSPDATSLMQRSTANGQGTEDGFFYSFWSDGGADATYKNLGGGSYSIEWSDGGNLVGGKGWNPGMDARYVILPLFALYGLRLSSFLSCPWPRPC